MKEERWPKFYVPTQAGSAILCIVRYENGSCLRIWQDGNQRRGSWDQCGETATDWGLLRQVESDETLLRQLPEEGTWQWATWKMHQKKCVSPVKGNHPHRIHEGKLEEYMWGSGTWRAHDYTHQRKFCHDEYRWHIVDDPEAPEDPESKAKTIDRKIDWDGLYPIVTASDDGCSYAIDSMSRYNCYLGYVVEGLECLDDDELPQMPEVWVRVENSWDMPMYLYHPPCSDRSRFYERRKAHAMRFIVGEDDEG